MRLEILDLSCIVFFFCDVLSVLIHSIHRSPKCNDSAFLKQCMLYLYGISCETWVLAKTIDSFLWNGLLKWQMSEKRWLKLSKVALAGDFKANECIFACDGD